MNADDLRKAISASPMTCSRCSKVACECWRELDRHLVFLPTSKAFICALKELYRNVEFNEKPGEFQWK